MKKMLITVLLMIMAVSFCIAEGSTEEKSDKKPVSLRMMYWMAGPRSERIKERAKEFEAMNPNTKIAVELTPSDGYWAKLQTSIVADMSPDVIEMSGSNFFQLIREDALLDITGYLAAEGLSLDDFYPSALEETVVNNRMYSFPFGVAPGSALYFNKNMFDKVGLPYPDNTWDVNDLRENAIKLAKDYDNDGRMDEWGFSTHWINYQTWPFIWGNNGQILNESKDKCLLDKPESIEALQYLTDFIQKYKVSPSPEWRSQAGIDFFMTGKMAMYIQGDWMISDYRKNITEFDWDITILPKGKKRASDVYVGGCQYCIPARSKHHDIAWEFLYYLAMKHMEVDSMEIGGLGFPSIKNIAETVVAPESDYAKLMEQVSYGHSIEFTPTWGEWYFKGWRQHALVMFNGEISVEEATKKMTQVIDEYLATEKKN